MSSRWLIAIAWIGMLAASASAQTNSAPQHRAGSLPFASGTGKAPSRDLQTLSQEEFYHRRKAQLQQAQASRLSNEQQFAVPNGVRRSVLERPTSRDQQLQLQQQVQTRKRQYEQGRIVRASYTGKPKRRQDLQDPFAEKIGLDYPFGETPASRNDFNEEQLNQKQFIEEQFNQDASALGGLGHQPDPFADPPQRPDLKEQVPLGVPLRQEPQQQESKLRELEKQYPIPQVPVGNATHNAQETEQLPPPTTSSETRPINNSPSLDELLDSAIQDEPNKQDPFADPPTQDSPTQESAGDPPIQDRAAQDPFGDPPQQQEPDLDPSADPPVDPSANSQDPNETMPTRDSKIKQEPPVISPEDLPNLDTLNQEAPPRPQPEQLPSPQQGVPNSNRSGFYPQRQGPPPIIQAPRQDGCPPVYQAPVYQQPDQPPVFQAPFDRTPEYVDPVYDPPVYHDPVYDQPDYEDTVYEDPPFPQMHPAYPEIHPPMQPAFEPYSGSADINMAYQGIAEQPFTSCDSCEGFAQDACYDPLYYFSLFGGASELERLSSADSAGTPFGFDLDSGYVSGVAMGQRLGYNLRSDFEFAYRKQEFDSLTVGAGGPFALDGEINSYAGMANLYWEFMSFPTQKLKPYVGAGIGFVIFDPTLNNTVVPFGHDDFDDSSFAYQFMTGVNYKLNSNSDLYVEYRYFNADDISINSDLNPFGGVTGSANFDFHSEDIIFGVRMKF